MRARLAALLVATAAVTGLGAAAAPPAAACAGENCPPWCWVIEKAWQPVCR